MTLRHAPVLLVALAALALPATVRAQESLGGCLKWNRLSRSLAQVSETHLKFVGNVEVECDETTLLADEMDVFTDTNIIVARGNVRFETAEAGISADRLEFNTQTRTGVFYNALGTVRLGPQVERSMFGTQEPDAMFWGEEIYKLGPKKYQIKKGGFTSCVQPTPRWELTSGDATVTLDSYALLRNPVLRVKGVPLLYVPALYYPLHESGRSTGFLIPTYGTSTVRGSSLSNAFFWAIDRSQDATFYHDWFTQTGQGVGAEYRYVAAPGSDGFVKTYLLKQHAATISQPGGGTTTIPASRDYEISANVTQALPGRLRARGRVDYFSSIQAHQLYHYNIYDASRRQRSYAFNVTGSWGSYLLAASVDHNEVFYSNTSSTTVGAMPRLGFSRSERPIGGSPLYFSVSSEYAALLRKSVDQTTEPAKTTDNGLQRVDVMPTVRLPFTRWPFLTVNTSLAWRATYWTRSLDPEGVQIDEGISRRYFDLQSQVTGPVFTRIWDTPGSGWAQKIKHVIEPSFAFRRVTAIDEFDRIVRLEGSDSVVGNVTRLNYALTNRLYVKPHEGGAFATPREIVNVAITQSYYTDANAAKYDQNYATSFTGSAPSHFSPVALTARVNPTPRIGGQFRTEYDTQFHAIRSFAANGSVSLGRYLQASGGWSQRRYIEGLPGFNNPDQLDHYINGSTSLRTPGGKIGGTYVFNYDLARDRFLQQRITGFYNAQCCGVALEYQVYNLLYADPRTGLTRDRRFNLSFTLAGVGTFSNFFGAFGGNQGTR